jgi:thiosulfate dehydrogenase (quinone) large subunit
MIGIRGLIAQGTTATQVPEPPIARFLFADTRMAVFWLLVRVYVGWQWPGSGVMLARG